MKKIIYIIGVLALLGVSSCQLDYDPAGTIKQDGAFQKMQDAKSFRNYLYVGLRNSFNGAYYYATDIQADLLNATLSYGHVNGNLYRWDLYSNDYTVRDLWAGPYGRLANVNFYIDNVVGAFTPKSVADSTTLATYVAEAHLARAILYRSLILRYAKDYEPSTASTDLGVPLVLHYDIKEKPARATIAQVYEQIQRDITSAKVGLKTPGTQNAKYLTADCILALQAQVALETHDYTGAVKAADSLIRSNRYPLSATSATLNTMWTNDNGTEIIFQPVYYDIAEASSGNAISEYIGYNGTIYSPRYVPEKWAVDLFVASDIRRNVFLKQYNISINGVAYNGIWLVNKYPGNPALYNSGAISTYVNNPKVFRIAEMYLIKAEALAWSGDDANALTALNDLRTKRGLAALTGVTGATLKQEILNERTREMFCEGTRLYDLKRFNLPFTRTAPQNSEFVVAAPADKTINLHKEAGNDLFVWGIPYNDMQTNPNLVQNRGW